MRKEGKTHGPAQRLSLVGVGKAPQRALLVREAAISLAVLLLRLQAQLMGHRCDPAPIPDEPVLVPGAREPQRACGRVFGLGAPIPDRGQRRRPGYLAIARDRVLRRVGGSLLEAQLAVGPCGG